MILLLIGLQLGGCGVVGVRFRPALIYTEEHADMTLDLVDKAMATVVDSRKQNMSQGMAA